MFIVRWIRSLLSLPILWMGQLFLRFKASPSVPLLSAAWTVGRDPEVGRMALAAIQQVQGKVAARAKAQDWLERRPRPQFASFAGLLAVDAGELDVAAVCLTRGRGLGDDPSGMLDWLEYLIAGQSGNALETALKFENRNDLPPDLSRTVLTELMFAALLRGAFEEARTRAARLLIIGDYPQAEMALWALAVREGDRRRAEAHLARAQMPPAPKAYFQVLGYRAIGANMEAQAALAELRTQDESLAAQAETLLKARETLNVPGHDTAVPAGPDRRDHNA